MNRIVAHSLPEHELVEDLVKIREKRTVEGFFRDGDNFIVPYDYAKDLKSEHELHSYATLGHLWLGSQLGSQFGGQLRSQIGIQFGI